MSRLETNFPTPIMAVMANIERKKSESDSILKPELHEVIFSPVFQPRLADIKFSRSFDEVPGLTVAFAPQKSYLKRSPAINNGNGHLKFGGVEGFLGIDNCVGIRLTDHGHEDTAFQEATAAVGQMKYEIPLSDKAEVAIIHSEDLPLWKRFYQHLEKSELLKKVGDRVLSVSGLDRQNRSVYISEIQNFRSIILENDEFLKRNGVVKEYSVKEWGLDMAFFSKDNHVIRIPLSHVKTAQLRGGVLIEKVLDNKVMTPGFVIRKPWETKREAYGRAEKAREIVSKVYKDRDIVIPVVSAGQNSLWKKMGFVQDLKNEIPRTSITTEEVVRYLYLGTDNLHPGPFSRNGLSLPPNSEGLGVDILLVDRAPGNMNFRYATVDQLLGYTKIGNKNLYRLEKVDNVGGIIIVPDGWQNDPKMLERIETQRRILMRYAQHAKEINIIPLDSKLFRMWKSMGSSILEKPEMTAVKGVISYGSKKISTDENNTDRDGTFLGIMQQGTQIGGVQMAIAQRHQGDTGYHVMDMGGVYSYTPQAYQEITARPTTASGIKLEMELQGLPMIPGIYFPEYILQSAVGFKGIADPENVSAVASYIRSELAHRFTISELKDVFGGTKAREIVRLGKLDEAIWYKKGNHRLLSMTNTHAHDDHDRGLFALDDVPLILRRQTLALLKAKTERAGTWRGQILNLALIQHEKIRNSFQRLPRDVRPVDFNNDQISLGRNLQENLFLVGHSLPGTGAPFFTSRDGSFKSVLYTADIRPDDTGHTQKMVEKVAGKADIIVMESTNAQDTNKISVGTTENDVRDSFAKLLKANENKPVIIMTPWHNLERMNSIQDVAQGLGRKVAFGYDHWEAIIQMAAEQKLSPANAEGFDYSYPVIGDDAALWARFMTKPLKYQETLSFMATGGKLGILDPKRLRKEGSDWIIVTSPSRLLIKDFNGDFWPNGVAVVHSAPFPYALTQKWMSAANKQWVERNARGRFFADFEIYGNGGRATPKVSPFGSLTASGHGTYEQNVQLLADLLGGTYKGKEIVIIHGEHSEKYSRMLKDDIAKKLGLSRPGDLKITGKLNTYSPSNPQKFKGHWIKLD